MSLLSGRPSCLYQMSIYSAISLLYRMWDNKQDGTMGALA